MVISIFYGLIFSCIVSGILAVYASKNDNKVISNFISWIISVLVLLIATIVSILMIVERYKFDIPAEILGPTWFLSGNIFVVLSLYIDQLSAIMLFVISFISLCVHFYSYFYFTHKYNVSRFLFILTLFTFSMMLLVTSGNLLQLFVGWEAISLCSYLLIAFYFQNNNKVKAASKAFLINRFADMAFVIALLSLLAIFETLNLSDIFKNIDGARTNIFTLFGYDLRYLDFIAILFVLAAFAKSAQLAFHIWLPDAMEAPTPVSALLHAATMVTAGIFLIIKLAPLFLISNISNTIIMIVSSVTLLYAGIVACFQNDLKKIIAYSTISQLGYMFLALGAQSYNGAFFHLTTHAFFKALLFLSAGAVIIALKGEQDIRKMGGLARKLPIVYLSMLIGSFALIGIPGFSGFYSKEVILNQLYLSRGLVGNFAYFSALAGVFFTAFYSFRLIIKVFHFSKYEEEVFSVGIGIKFVLLILSILSAIVGYILYNYFVGDLASVVWRSSVFPYTVYIKEDLNLQIEYISLFLIFIAFFINYIIYIRDKNLPVYFKKQFFNLYQLFLNQFYFDYFYDVYIVNFANKSATLLAKFEKNMSDKYATLWIGRSFQSTSKLMSRLQNGIIEFYALLMLVGIAVILMFIILFY